MPGWRTNPVTATVFAKRRHRDAITVGKAKWGWRPATCISTPLKINRKFEIAALNPNIAQRSGLLRAARKQQRVDHGRQSGQEALTRAIDLAGDKHTYLTNTADRYLTHWSRHRRGARPLRDLGENFRTSGPPRKSGSTEAKQPGRCDQRSLGSRHSPVHARKH